MGEKSIGAILVTQKDSKMKIFSHALKRIMGVFLLIDAILFGSVALYALVMNTYGG